MCGIAGIIDFASSRDTAPALVRMIGLMMHRGPDAHGIVTAPGMGLASTRLSIIDLATGDQPIHNEDKSVWVVLNGEIFNYPELREQLKAKGHRFYTRSDTEVLVHLYEDEGPAMLDRLNGQFAIALWDAKRQRLMLARDRVGIRPLFYHLSGDCLVFGSEIKTLFADASVPREIDLLTIADIFTCWTPLDGATAFKGIRQLPAGHYALFSEQGLELRQYWSLDFSDPGEAGRTPREWADELNSLLLDAIRIRLRADVPVGAYLSGGLDSTFITSLVRQNFNNRLSTFSVTFADSRYDEACFQEQAISALNTMHKEIKCTEQDIGDNFDRVVWHSEVPLLRTGPAPLFMLSGLVRAEGYKVVLTGEGADEMFGGYNIFKEDKIRRFWARCPDSELRPRLIERLYPYIFSNASEKTRGFLNAFFRQGLSETGSVFYSHLLRWRNTVQLQNFFSMDIRDGLQPLDVFLQRCKSMLPDGFEKWHPMSRAQYLEISIFMTNYLLSSQGDRMAMGHSVEGRFPYLDHRVMEFATRIPPHYRMRGLNEKYILKESARGIIPDQLVQRPKQPYRAPISRCFLGPDAPGFAKWLLSEQSIKDKGYFDHKKVAGLLKKYERQEGALLSERENMAVVGILSTQLLDELFLRDFPPFPVSRPADVKRLSCMCQPEEQYHGK